MKKRLLPVVKKVMLFNWEHVRDKDVGLLSYNRRNGAWAKIMAHLFEALIDMYVEHVYSLND